MYYKPSGRFSGIFFVFLLLFIAIAVPILSFVYIYLIHYIPIIYFNIIITVGCGLAVGFSMNFMVKLAKVRNVILVIISLVFVTIILKYFQWCVYIPMIFADSDFTFLDHIIIPFEIFLHPDMILELALYINSVGVWSIGTSDIPVRGVILFIVWIIEFIIIMGAAILIGKDRAKLPFSEEFNDWYTEIPNKIIANIPQNIEALKSNLENGNFDELVQLSKEENNDELNFLEITLYQSPNADHYYLKADQVSITIDDKEKEKRNETALIEYLAINKDSAKALSE